MNFSDKNKLMASMTKTPSKYLKQPPAQSSLKKLNNQQSSTLLKASPKGRLNSKSSLSINDSKSELLKSKSPAPIEPQQALHEKNTAGADVEEKNTRPFEDANVNEDWSILEDYEACEVIKRANFGSMNTYNSVFGGVSNKNFEIEYNADYSGVVRIQDPTADNQGLTLNEFLLNSKANFIVNTGEYYPQDFNINQMNDRLISPNQDDFRRDGSTVCKVFDSNNKIYEQLFHRDNADENKDKVDMFSESFFDSREIDLNSIQAELISASEMDSSTLRYADNTQQFKYYANFKDLLNNQNLSLKKKEGSPDKKMTKPLKNSLPCLKPLNSKPAKVITPVAKLTTVFAKKNSSINFRKGYFVGGQAASKKDDSKAHNEKKVPLITRTKSHAFGTKLQSPVKKTKNPPVIDPSAENDRPASRRHTICTPTIERGSPEIKVVNKKPLMPNFK